MNLYNRNMIFKTNKRKFMELLRECRKQLWLYETKQIVHNEREIQKLNIIHENILDYLDITRVNKSDFC